MLMFGSSFNKVIRLDLFQLKSHYHWMDKKKDFPITYYYVPWWRYALSECSCSYSDQKNQFCLKWKIILNSSHISEILHWMHNFKLTSGSKIHCYSERKYKSGKNLPPKILILLFKVKFYFVIEFIYYCRYCKISWFFGDDDKKLCLLVQRFKIFFPRLWGTGICDGIYLVLETFNRMWVCG